MQTPKNSKTNNHYVLVSAKIVMTCVILLIQRDRRLSTYAVGNNRCFEYFGHSNNCYRHQFINIYILLAFLVFAFIVTVLVRCLTRLEKVANDVIFL